MKDFTSKGISSFDGKLNKNIFIQDISV